MAPARYSPEQAIEVLVRFELVGEETHVVVEHTGSDAIAPKHAARRGTSARSAQKCLARYAQLCSRVGFAASVRLSERRPSRAPSNTSGFSSGSMVNQPNEIPTYSEPSVIAVNPSVNRVARPAFSLGQVPGCGRPLANYRTRASWQTRTDPMCSASVMA
jgi:hypothetical protein